MIFMLHLKYHVQRHYLPNFTKKLKKTALESTYETYTHTLNGICEAYIGTHNKRKKKKEKKRKKGKRVNQRE